MENLIKIAINIDDFMTKLSSIDVLNNNTRTIWALIIDIKRYIYKKEKIRRYYHRKVTEFEKFKEKKEYKQLCYIIIEKIVRCLDFIEYNSGNNLPIDFIKKDIDSIKDLNIMKDYIYSLLFYSSINWMITYLENENDFDSVNHCYKGLIELYFFITNIILSSDKYDKYDKDHILADSNLYLELQNKNFDYKNINNLSNFYFFDLLSKTKELFKFLDNKSSIIIFKSIINGLLIDIRTNLDDIYNITKFYLIFNEEDKSILFKDKTISLTEKEYQIIQDAKDTGELTLGNIKRQTIGNINKKFRDTYGHNLFARKQKNKIYKIDEDHYRFY